MINLNNYKKAKQEFLLFIKELLINLQKDLTKDYDGHVPPIEDSLVEEAANNILNNNIRSLYTFFDKKNIYMYPKYSNNKFSWVIGDTESDILYTDRFLCEEDGFINCFKILDES